MFPNVYELAKKSKLSKKHPWIGNSNRDPATSSKKGHSECFTTDLDRLLNKALQAPSFRGDSVILIAVPYCILAKQEEKEQTIVVLVNKNLLAT